MQIKDLFIRNKGVNSFRPGKIAKVVGVKWCKPEGCPWRLAYEIRYPDGIKDQVSVDCRDLYTLLGKENSIEYTVGGLAN